MREPSFLAVVALVLASDVATAAASGKRWVCEAGGCRAGFVLHTFWHDVEGSTSGVTAKVDSASGDPIADGVVAVSVDAASLVTGIGKRDRKMREEHLETDRHPRLEFRSTAPPVRATGDGPDAEGNGAGGGRPSPAGDASDSSHGGGGPSAGPRGPVLRDAGGPAPGAGESGPLEIRGDLTVHGVTRQVVVRVRAERSGEDWIVHGRFTLRLSEFGIPDPSIILNKVDDEVEAWIEVRLEPGG